jgi:hypothetical protein
MQMQMKHFLSGIAVAVDYDAVASGTYFFGMSQFLRHQMHLRYKMSVLVIDIV